jgi:AcrR family transcriptional regulator
MARSLSENKRAAILNAAVLLMAKRGVDATPTAAISAAARIAEGSLYTYFSSKDALLNEVFRNLRRDLADALLTAYPKAAEARVRFRHIWDRYVHWGVTHPDKFRVLAQLHVSQVITADSRIAGSEALKEIERLAKDSMRKRRIRNHPLPYLAALMATMAETTIGFVAQNKNARVDYGAAGFEIFWAGIAVS